MKHIKEKMIQLTNEIVELENGIEVSFIYYLARCIVDGEKAKLIEFKNNGDEIDNYVKQDNEITKECKENIENHIPRID